MTNQPPHRNALASVHQRAEGLYDNAVALSQLLDVYSKRTGEPDLTTCADYLEQNLINARANLDALERAIAEYLPIFDHTKELTHA